MPRQESSIEIQKQGYSPETQSLISKRTANLHKSGLKRKGGLGNELFDAADRDCSLFHIFGFMDSFPKLPGGCDAGFSYSHDRKY